MAATLPTAIEALIRDEQARQGGRFIEAPDLDAYLAKLAAHAEFVSAEDNGRCRGFVAFYCNDLTTRRAFITLVAVAPEDRRSGLGRTLVEQTFDVCRSRGFTACGLEVRSDNQPALSLYQSLGFVIVGERDGRQVLERSI